MIQKEIRFEDGTKLTYFKPSQVRKIPLKQSSIRGYIPSLKSNLKGEVWN